MNSKDMAKPDAVVDLAEECLTSLTGDLDFEPELEFDDSELNPPSRPRSREFCLDVSDDFLRELSFTDEDESLPPLPSPYRTIRDDDLLVNRKIVEVFGDDNLGRRLICVYACRIPITTAVPSDKLLQYFIWTLDKYVEQDYTLVYFHYGLNKNNRPPLTWYWNAYKEFDKKYKKNLKALYIVHPTKFVKTVWALLKPVISIKFGKKITYYNYLYELRQQINFDSINIPTEVIEHDNRMLARDPKAGTEAIGWADPFRANCNTCEFHVSLKFIQQNNPRCKDNIPPIMRTCVEHLSSADAMESEGIFRRSCNTNIVGEMQEQMRNGHELVFTSPHAAAVLLKTFLRQLSEPLLTFALYDEVSTFMEWPQADRMQRATTLIIEQLPFENYLVLNYLLDFLTKVADRACLNKMNSSNLSIVFGPNLAWPATGDITMEHVQSINEFTNFILEHHREIFIITSIE